MFSAFANSSLQRLCTTLTFDLDDRELEDVPVLEHIMQFPHYVRAFQNLQNSRIKCCYWTCEETWQVTDGGKFWADERWLQWLENMGFMCKAMRKMFAATDPKAQPRLTLMFGAYIAPPPPVALELSLLAQHAAKIEIVEIRFESPSPYTLSRQQVSIAEIFGRPLQATRLMIRRSTGDDDPHEFTNISGNLFSGCRDATPFENKFVGMPNTSWISPSGVQPSFLPGLRELNLSNVVIEARQLRNICNSLCRQLRKMSVSHVPICCMKYRHGRCNLMLYEDLFGHNSAFYYLRHLNELEELSIEICDRYMAWWFSRHPQGLLDPLTNSEHTTRGKCSTCKKRGCWDIGGYYLSIVAKQP